MPNFISKRCDIASNHKVATGDYIHFLNPWIEFIKENGYFHALQYDFYNYTPSYIYILTLIAQTGLNPLFAIKAVSVLFEYLTAFFIGRTATDVSS